MRRTVPRGLTLVELLVGLALGLFVVALATGVLVQRVQAQQALFAEARLMHDLHASMALMGGIL